jgi:hypothetical protein
MNGNRLDTIFYNIGEYLLLLIAVIYLLLGMTAFISSV